MEYYFELWPFSGWLLGCLANLTLQGLRFDFMTIVWCDRDLGPCWFLDGVNLRVTLMFCTEEGNSNFLRNLAVHRTNCTVYNLSFRSIHNRVWFLLEILSENVWCKCLIFPSCVNFKSATDEKIQYLLTASVITRFLACFDAKTAILTYLLIYSLTY